jgi:zinc protease
MKVSKTDNINIIKNLPEKSLPNKQKEEVSVAFKSELPSVYAAGQSLVNTNNPISYSKIGEIEIPGVKEKASIFKLANGQKVIIAPKPGPTYVKTTYNVGSMNETEDIRGISHFIEHNLFNGSKDLAPREYDKKVSDLGGNTNASTSFSVTDYFLGLQLINDNSLEEAIKLNALQTQFPTFPVEQLEKEKEPVKSEIDMYKDMPDDVARSLALKNLFNVNTQSTDFIIGTKENINSFTREKVLDYYNTWYTPDNAVTVVTGDVDTDETIKLISKYYNKKNDYSNINKRHYEQIKYNDKPIRQDVILPNATSACAIMTFAIPEGTSKSELDKIDALTCLFTSSSSSMHKALDKDGLMLDCYIEKMQNKPNGARAFVGTINGTENQIEGAIKTVYEELTKIANNPPSQSELAAVKKRMINSIKATAESSSDMNSTLTSMVLNNDYGYFTETINNINAMTPEDISATARKYLDLNKISMCVSHEKNANSALIGNNYNSTLNTPKSVSFGASAKPKESISKVTDNIKEFRLPNNIETSFVNGVNGAKASLIINYQSDSLNNVTSPAFSVLSTMLNRGSLYKNNDTVNEIKAANDIKTSFNASHNGISVVASFNDENLNTATGLIKETLLSPNLTESEFIRAKKIIKDNIENQPKSAYDNIEKELYPELKTYASKEEKLRQLDALTLADIQKLYADIVNTSQAAVNMVAPVEDKPYMADMVNAEFSVMPMVKPFSLQHSESYNIYKPNTEAKTIIDTEEKAQAEIVRAYTFKEMKNIDDIAKLNLLEFILGGSMSSRLFTDLRETQKLAYNVGSGIFGEKDTGAIYLHILTTTESLDPEEGSPENLKKSLDGFDKNVNLLKTQNVSETELENAKIKIKSEILDLMETNNDKNIVLCKSKDSHYGKEYYKQLMDSIDKVTADDIKAAANHIFSYPPITSIVASKRTLETLNLK